MGLILKLRDCQRLFIDSVTIEVSMERGQFKLHFDGPNPFPFDLKKEDNEEYRKRMRSRGDHEHKICDMQQSKFKKNP